MKIKRIAVMGVLVAFIGVAAMAQSTSQNQATGAPAQKQMTMKEVKEKLGMVVFPAKGQTPEQQEADELECLQWAVDQLNSTQMKDPNAAGAAAKEQAKDATTGAAVKGAAKGAAAGALFGAIVGDAGTGAAVGAAGGAIAGRRAKKQAEAQAEAQAKAKADAENKAKLETVKKGMTACLEAKGYTVR
jgi:hypothetical protein